MVIAVSAGGQVQRPLASVLIGGLTMTMVFPLFVLPAVYRWFGGKAKVHT